MSTLTSTLNDLEMNLDEDMMESMAVILGVNRSDEDTVTAPQTQPH